MIIITGTFLVLLFCFGIESLLKVRWLKITLHFAVTAAVAIAVFRFALDAGGKVERYQNAQTVADTLELFEESTRSNSLAEVHAKLLIVHRELPEAIRSAEPTTAMLLKTLLDGSSTNSKVRANRLMD